MHKTCKSLKVIFILILFLFLSGCANKQNIKLSVTEPAFHSQLKDMMSIHLIKKEGKTIFNLSSRYTRHGVQVIILKGSPYELGYARGILLKNEMRNWVKDNIYMIKKLSFGTNVGINLMKKRAKKIEQYIPFEYKDELLGLAAGSKIDYETILMLNVLDTVGRQFGCTSVAVKDLQGNILRSRNLDYKGMEFFSRQMLYIYKPDKGYAFATVSPPGLLGIFTAINEKGLTFGDHDICASSKSWQGIPSGILNRQIVQSANSVKAVKKILQNAQRCLPRMYMVTDKHSAGIYEFDSKNIKFIKMKNNYLILTNHTQKLNIGQIYHNSSTRFNEAESYILKNSKKKNLTGLIALNRQPAISWKGNPEWHNIHSVIFNSTTHDFWIAIDNPPATNGKWIGFNLENELNDSMGKKPDIKLIPAL